jgi:lipid II:glycine glycyltransferase (peptidoglycan interpeptide bridge formation enzyme)
LRLSTLTALRLPASYDELRQHFTTHHRRNVKQAQRAGCQVQVSDSHDDLVEFHALVQATLGRAGVADVPLSFYAVACRRLIDAGNGRLYLIRDGGRIIAGIFIVSNQRRSFYWLGGLERHESVTAKRPMFLLFDTAFRDAIERGHEEFELGGVPNEGLSRFKLGWGAVAEPFVYVDCLNPALRFAHHLFSRVRGLQRS